MFSKPLSAAFSPRSLPRHYRTLNQLIPIQLLSSFLKPQRKQNIPIQSLQSYRFFSSTEGAKPPPLSATEGETVSTVEEKKVEENHSKDIRKIDYDEYDDYEPKTAKEKVSYYTAVGLRLGLLALGAVCIFFTAKELFPGRLNPNSLFSETFDYLRYKDEIIELVGEDMKAFGRDVGHNTEGRRNHVDSYSYKAEDGSNRLRIRFNIKGSRAQILVWVEVSDKLPDNEYVYVIVQSLRTGRVKTFVDNRDQIEANLISSDNDGFVKSLQDMFFKK